MERNGEMDQNNVLDRLADLATDGRLHALEELPSEAFNVFEALGEVRRELGHSTFLAFLLDPRGNHGLSDALISRLLARTEPSLDVSPVAAAPRGESLWTVQRELPSVDPDTRKRGRIDILLLDHAHRHAVIIENKIDSGEHGNQLLRYYKDIRSRYEGWEVRGIYLTPRGDEPSCAHYVSLSYGHICAAIDDTRASCGDNIHDDVRAALRHYVDMIRRRIVNEFDIDRECQRIYLDHGVAIATVQERVDTMQTKIGHELEAMVQAQKLANNGRFMLGKRGRWEKAQLVTFVPEGWHAIKLPGAVPLLNADSMLDFQIFNWPQRVDLYLKIVPGHPNVRRSLLELASKHRQPDGPFDVLDSPSQGYIRVYSHALVVAARYADSDWDGLMAEIHEQWTAFITRDLLRIDEAIRQWSN